jgi:putative heme iron utilization protein
MIPPNDSMRRGDATNDDGSLAEVLRSLLVRRSVGALATLHDGRPFASMIPFAAVASAVASAGATSVSHRLRLVTHVSGLAAHTRDMLSHPEVCLLVTAPESPGVMPQALPRVSLSAVAEFIPADHSEHAALKAAYVAKFPEAADFFMLGDFSLVVLEPVSARLVAGFARAVTLGPAALAAAVAERPG